MEFGVGRNALQRPMDGDEAVSGARWILVNGETQLKASPPVRTLLPSAT
jgi:hypothetical protein